MKKTSRFKDIEKTKSNHESNVEKNSSKTERILWPDIAKGISILLVVLWHAKVDGEGSMTYINNINEGLIFLRMPLFFFVSGFFISKSLNKKWKVFFELKISNLIYLFLVWGIINDFMMSTLPKLIGGYGFEMRNPLMFFIEPPATLWFIYALSIGFVVMKIVYKAPIWLMLPLMFACYYFAALNGEWRSVPFIVKLGRLIPYMYLGLISFDWIKIRIGLVYKYFSPMILFLPFVFYKLMLSDYTANPIITCIASLSGLLILLSFSYHISHTSVGKVIDRAGKNSLYIYVMHKIPIRYSKFALSIFNKIDPILVFVGLFLVGVTIPLLIRRYLVKGRVVHLFKSPLMKKRTMVQ